MRLRTDLLRYAPDVAMRFGLRAEDAPSVEQSAAEVLPPARGPVIWAVCAAAVAGGA